jgi:hypothetical protein
MQSPIASKPKPSVSKLESYEFLGYFDWRSVNTETSSRVSSLGGKKHGSIRVSASESRSSNDATLDEILSMDSTLFSTDQDVQCNEMCLNQMDMSTKKSVRYRKVRTLTCNFFRKRHSILGGTEWWWYIKLHIWKYRIKKDKTSRNVSLKIFHKGVQRLIINRHSLSIEFFKWE